jgi:hypothetical protein
LDCASPLALSGGGDGNVGRASARFNVRTGEALEIFQAGTSAKNLLIRKIDFNFNCKFYFSKRPLPA